MNQTTEMADVSYCQKGALHWDKIGESFGALAGRSSQSYFLDSEWVEFITNCKRIGMPHFGWHFVQPDQGEIVQIEAISEAWDMMAWKPLCWGFDLEDIVYDVNNSDGTKTRINITPPSREKATLWLMMLIYGVMKKTGLSKKSMIIYTRTNYWDKWILPSGTVFTVNGEKFKAPNWDEFSLWIAAWQNYTNEIVLPKDFTKYLIHQYQGGSGTDPNVDGPIDKDRFNGTYAEMISAIGKPEPDAVVPVTPPAPITIPYTATIEPSFISVWSKPSYGSAAVQVWPKHGDKVMVSEETGGFAHIAQGWVGLTYTLGGILHQSLENKVSINPPTPPPPPTPVPVPIPVVIPWTVTINGVGEKPKVVVG